MLSKRCENVSSKSIDKDQTNLNGRDFNGQARVNFKQIIIEFSSFGKSEKIAYIYYGNEKIPFRERHPIYKIIFRNEFAEEIRDITRNL